MELFTVDFETYWSTEYTLSKLTTEEYVRDPRFSIHMVGIKRNNEKTVVLSKVQFQSLLDSGLRAKLQGSIVLCQNVSFDGFILSEVYGVVPAFYLDSMSMFMCLYPHKRASLKVISETLGLKAKGGASGYSVINTRNKVTLAPEEYAACAEYCIDDVDIAYEAFQKMKPFIPARELQIIDQTTRWMTMPVLRLEQGPITEELNYERSRKAELLSRIGQDKTILASNQKFAELLISMGIEPPIKPSPTALKKDNNLKEKVTGLKADGNKLTPALCEENDIPWAYAFGKTDTEFKHLLNHEDPMVIAAVEARMGVKSTTAETRAERFLGISRRGALPVPLKYWGAATGRWSAGGSINMQNLQRGSRLRKAIVAPDGYMLAVCDLSAIEARVLAWVAGQEDILNVFRNGDDIYCDMAGKIYNREVTRKDTELRRVGKAAALGSGYSMGWKKFQEFAVLVGGVEFTAQDADQMGACVERFMSNKNNAKFVRANKPSFKTEEAFATHCAAAEFVIAAYRTANYMIERFWNDSYEALYDIHQGKERNVGVLDGVITTCRQGYRFPGDRFVRYADLTPRQDGKRVEWTRSTREGTGFLSRGLTAENIVQALSRHIMADQMMMLVDEGYRVVLTCHDEIVLCESEDKAEAAYERLHEVMSTPPQWAKGLPLAAEGAVCKSYGDAK